MRKIQLGQVEYLNCVPVYHSLETGETKLDADIIKGPPTALNKLFLEGQLDVDNISSIEYARNADKCVILPDLSISSDGQVKSILLFSKIPITEMEGKTVYLTSSSATSVVLLKILLEHYYQVNVQYITGKPDLKKMLKKADAALLIGDDALTAHFQVKKAQEPLHVLDLGEAWKEFTGEKMVYALWVINRDFAVQYPSLADQIARTLVASKNLGLSRIPTLTAYSKTKSLLPEDQIADYFRTIKYEFNEDDRRALLTYYDYAYKSGLIKERVKLTVWGEDSWPASVGF